MYGLIIHKNNFCKFMEIEARCTFLVVVKTEKAENFVNFALFFYDFCPFSHIPRIVIKHSDDIQLYIRPI